MPPTDRLHLPDQPRQDRLTAAVPQLGPASPAFAPQMQFYAPYAAPNSPDVNAMPDPPATPSFSDLRVLHTTYPTRRDLRSATPQPIWLDPNGTYTHCQNANYTANWQEYQPAHNMVGFQYRPPGHGPDVYPQTYANTGHSPAESYPIQEQPPIEDTGAHGPSFARTCEWKGCESTRKFKRPHDLERHVKTQHIFPGSYKCPECPKTFNRRDNCEEHRRRRHPGSG
ncbi:hypothetical protein BDW62DRAFT_190313 [Aspergillus aurantiobrunneus]